MKKIALIGSTGSIGRQTLSIVENHPDKFQIVSLSAGQNEALFLEQVKKFSPKVATLKKESDLVKEFKNTQFFFGEKAYTNAIINEADIVVVALVGFSGLLAVLDAIEKGKNIALANKESLVVGGELVTRLAKEKGVSIVPIDSEHSAIWQALDFDFNKSFNKLIITASGGAFRDLSIDELKCVKAQDALKHPNWDMGNKITIDCATMVNKAFEVIEAKWLYNTTFDKIDVLIHRQSIVHSLVEFIDGAIMAQLGAPSMEIPIQTALTYPERLSTKVDRVDLAKIASLTFSEVDNQKYPCFSKVIKGAKLGGGYTAVINGANEYAVGLFLQDKIAFNQIYEGISCALDAYDGKFTQSFSGYEECNNFGVSIVKSKFGE